MNSLREGDLCPVLVRRSTSPSVGVMSVFAWMPRRTSSSYSLQRTKNCRRAGQKGATMCHHGHHTMGVLPLIPGAMRELIQALGEVLDCRAGVLSRSPRIPQNDEARIGKPYPTANTTPPWVALPRKTTPAFRAPCVPARLHYFHYSKLVFFVKQFLKNY